VQRSHLNATLGPKDATCKVVQTTDYQSAALSPDDPTFRTLLFRQAPTEADLDYCCLAPPTLESAAYSSVSEIGGRMKDKDGIDLTPPTVGILAPPPHPSPLPGPVPSKRDCKSTTTVASKHRPRSAATALDHGDPLAKLLVGCTHARMPRLKRRLQQLS
jgi:hypothetical protein